VPSSILLVDDDADSRELLGSLLREEGHDVHLAQHGREALSMLPGLPRPCTVLLDLNMPEMSGELVLRVLAEEKLGDAVPVILISADDKALEIDYPTIVARLCKPFELGTLKRVLVDRGPIDSTGG
jgi:CheY-like chemotaxis protein